MNEKESGETNSVLMASGLALIGVILLVVVIGVLMVAFKIVV